MQTFHRLFGVFLTCFAAAATLPGGLVVPVNAAILEEVIVTAQKREQQLSDVGISVTAFTGEQIKEFGLTDSVDLSSMTPGLQYTVPNAEGSQINFFIRGSGLNEAGDANENPVGVLVDDVYRGAIGGLHFPMFDMERTEVLRGPQGTLYGRNTTGGLIHFITNRPTEEFEGYGDISFARHDQVKFEGAISGSLNESKSLLGRVSGSVNQHDGYTENRFPVSTTTMKPTPSRDACNCCGDLARTCKSWVSSTVPKTTPRWVPGNTSPPYSMPAATTVSSCPRPWMPTARVPVAMYSAIAIPTAIHTPASTIATAKCSLKPMARRPKSTGTLRV